MYDIGRIAWIICSHILSILITAHDWHPNHHMHLSTSGQIRFVFISHLLKLWASQDCLNHLQSYPQHSSHCLWLKSQSPYALFNFSPYQFFCFISLIKFLSLAGLLEYFVLIINRQTWSPSPSHSTLQHTPHSRLGLVLLVSRQLIMMAAGLVKLTCSSWIPQQAASTSTSAHWQECSKGAAKQQ